MAILCLHWVSHTEFKQTANGLCCVELPVESPLPLKVLNKTATCILDRTCHKHLFHFWHFACRQQDCYGLLHLFASQHVSTCSHQLRPSFFLQSVWQLFQATLFLSSQEELWSKLLSQNSWNIKCYRQNCVRTSSIKYFLAKAAHCYCLNTFLSSCCPAMAAQYSLRVRASSSSVRCFVSFLSTTGLCSRRAGSP